MNGEKVERSEKKEGERGKRQSRALLDAVAITATLAGERAQVEAGVHGNHLGQDLQDLLRHGLVVDRDQVLGLRVHLQGPVERESSLDLVGT